MSNKTEFIGGCRFCGQVIRLDMLAEEETENERDERATLMCSCQEAREYQTRVKTLKKAETNIRMMVESEDAAKALIDCTPLIVTGDIEGMTINFGNGKKLAMSLGKTGHIKLKATETKSRTMEE